MKTNFRSSLALLLTLCFGFAVAPAQVRPAAPEPVIQTGTALDPYSILSTDPAVDRAVAYLKTLGASEPKRLDQVIASPGVFYVLSTLTFTDVATGNSCTVIAGLAALFPNVTANDLARNGVITLASPLYNLPVPGVNIASSKASPALAVPQSPIGPRQFPGNPDAVGDDYYIGPYDFFPLNHLYTDAATGRVFVKMGTASPFGVFGAHWHRIA